MNKYRTSEIIFGTREQFLELRKKLLLLEKLTIISNRKDVKKIIYEIVSSNSNQKFICNLLDNRSLFQDMKDYLKSWYSYYPTIGVGYSELEKDNNGDYIFKDSEFNNIVYIKDQNRFCEIIEEIQNSDFYKEMLYKKICTNREKLLNYIKVNCGGIYVSNIVKDNRYGKLFYNPDFDVITADKLYGLFPAKITKKDVQDLLNVEINGSSLSDYQKALIDNSESAKKKIIIDECNEKIAYFGIEEKPDSIHLVKIKRKNLRFSNK